MKSIELLIKSNLKLESESSINNLFNIYYLIKVRNDFQIQILINLFFIKFFIKFYINYFIVILFYFIEFYFILFY